MRIFLKVSSPTIFNSRFLNFPVKLSQEKLPVMTRRVLSTIRPADLQSGNLKEIPEAWEDGARTPPGPGFYERWNFEASFDDGSTAAIVFFTRPLLESSNSASPGVSLTITCADGKKRNEVKLVERRDFTASKERCYVRAGPSWVRQIDRIYELSVTAGKLSAHLNFTPVLPPWRPGSGRYDCDAEGKLHFAWFAPVPHGKVEGQLVYDGKIHPVHGTCYHDHRWGSAGINEVLSQWYWGRARVGEYTILFAEMTATEKYGSQAIPIFYLARGSQILTGDGAPLRVEALEYRPDPGGRSYPSAIDLTWEKGPEKVCLQLRDPVLMDSFSLVDFLPTFQRIIGGLVANPYSFRLQTALGLDINLGHVQEQLTGQALYELMLFR
jgi:hypothetical protein